MKNTLPLILAVALGLVAVFLVSRMIKPNSGEKERQYVDVVYTTRVITPADSRIQESWLRRQSVEKGSCPVKAIPWERMKAAVGQKVLRTVSKDDYLLMSDIVPEHGVLSSKVPEGKWAVPVTFSDPSLVQFLQPGDEIAIMGTFMAQKIVKKTDASERPDVIEERATSVIFPCVEILDVGNGDAIRRDDDETSGQGTIVVVLTPQQAETLVAAQRTMELYPALRKTNDGSALKRRDVGVVNDSTFQGLKENLDTVTIPDNPVTK